MDSKLHDREPCNDHVLLLSLKEHLDGEGEDDAVEEGDEPEGDGAGGGGDGFVLAEEGEDGGGEEEDGEE